MRQAIARLTVRSKQEMPHFYVSAGIDMTMAMTVRQQLNMTLEAQKIRISVNDLIPGFKISDLHQARCKILPNHFIFRSQWHYSAKTAKNFRFI